MKDFIVEVSLIAVLFEYQYYVTLFESRFIPCTELLFAYSKCLFFIMTPLFEKNNAFGAELKMCNSTIHILNKWDYKVSHNVHGLRQFPQCVSMIKL